MVTEREAKTTCIWELDTEVHTLTGSKNAYLCREKFFAAPDESFPSCRASQQHRSRSGSAVSRCSPRSFSPLTVGLMQLSLLFAACLLLTAEGCGPKAPAPAAAATETDGTETGWH